MVTYVLSKRNGEYFLEKPGKIIFRAGTKEDLASRCKKSGIVGKDDNITHSFSPEFAGYVSVEELVEFVGALNETRKVKSSQ